MPTSGTRVTTSRPSSEAAPASTRTASPTRRSPWPTCSPAPQPRPTGPVGAEMDWAGWALFGVLAATALTAVIIAAQVAGLTRLDLPSCWSACHLGPGPGRRVLHPPRRRHGLGPRPRGHVRPGAQCHLVVRRPAGAPAQ